jgi:hypothetical protein
MGGGGRHNDKTGSVKKHVTKYIHSENKIDKRILQTTLKWYPFWGAAVDQE